MPNLLPNTLDVNIVRMYKALFDEAPGYTLLSAYRQLGTVQAVSESLNAQFANLSNAQWAGLIAQNLHMSAAQTSPAVAFITGMLAAGNKRADILAGILLGYANSYESDGLFGPNAQYFNNSVLTSYTYSIDPTHTTTNQAVLLLADEPNTAPTLSGTLSPVAATEGGAIIAGTLATKYVDAEGDTLTFSLAQTQVPVPGLTFNSNGGYLFDPTSAAYDFVKAGTVYSQNVAFVVSDGKGGVTNGTLVINVTGTNDAPTAQNVSAQTLEDNAVAVTPVSTDPDQGDTAAYSVVTQPLHGTVTFNAGTGQFTYTPNLNFNGADSFTYKVTDGSGATSVATATVNVAPVNDAPVAANGTASGDEDTAIGGSVTATDVDSAGLTFALASSPAHGSVALNANGSYVYTPNANFNGTDTFTFVASDGQLSSNAATVTITVRPVNDAPVAQNVTATGQEDQAGGIAVTPVWTDVDTGDTATVTLVSQPANGTVGAFNTATGKFTYTPNLNFNGVDSFVYKVTDAAGASSIAVATVTVQAVNDPPVANSLSISGFENQDVAGQVTGTDVDIGDHLTFSTVTQPTNGTVTMDPDGNFVYHPNPFYYGADSFTYQVKDSGNLTATNTVTISLSKVDNVLTTGIDGFTGSVQDDTWLANQNTLNAGDSINGAGGNDNLIVGIEGDAAGPTRNFGAFVLQNLETVTVTNDSADVAVFDMSSSNGVQHLQSNNSTADVVFNFANTTPDSNANGFDEVNLDVIDPTATTNITLDVRNSDAAGLDELNLNVTSSDVVTSEAHSINVVAEAYSGVGAVDQTTASGIEMVNFTTNGSHGAIIVDDLNTPGATTLNINTAFGVKIGDTDNTLLNQNNQIENPVSASISTVDAHLSTAAVILSTADNNGNVTILGGSGNDRFETGAGNDSLVTGAGNDSVFTGAGNDFIDAGTGNDFIRAGSGDNTILAGAGDDNVQAGQGADSIVGGDGNDTIDAGSGNNSVSGGEGNDVITVGEDNDTVDGGNGNDTINFGDGGNDIISGGAGNDVLNAGNGLASNYSEFFWSGAFTLTDAIDGGDGTDTLNLTGDSGDANELDTVKNVEQINLTGGGSYSIQVNDGSWFDTDTTTATVIDAHTIGGTLWFNGNDGGAGTNDGPVFNVVPSDDGVLSRSITIIGGSQNDTISTGLGTDLIKGGAGNDILSAGAGNDTVYSGPGTDNVDLGTGNDVAVVFTNELDATDTVAGGGGNDTIRFDIVDNIAFSGEVSNATLDAGISGIGTLLVNNLDHSGYGQQVNVTLNVGYAQTALTIDATSLDSSEWLNLDASNNAANENLTVLGGAGSDWFAMGDNLDTNDSIVGGGGNNHLTASSVVDADFTHVSQVGYYHMTGVNDTAVLGPKAQAAGIGVVYDAGGNDTIDATGYTTGIYIAAFNGGNDSITTGGGNDTVVDWGGTDTISTGAGNDYISDTGGGNDSISAGDGNDTVDGMTGSDSVSGGAGNDTIIAYGSELDGNDTIDGGAGNDELQLSDGQGNVNAVIDLPKVTNIENIVAQDTDSGLGNAFNVFNITFQNGNVDTETVVNVSGRGVSGSAFGSDDGDALNVNLRNIGDADYAFNITGGAGSDTVTGSPLPENMNFQAGGGNDVLNVDGTDMGTTLTMDGGSGIDTINLLSGGMTDDSFTSISHIEVLGVEASAAGGGLGMNVRLGANADASLDEVSAGGMVTINGTQNNDSVFVDPAFNDNLWVTLGTGGNDTVDAHLSSSTVIIDPNAASVNANDILKGGTGANDELRLWADSDATGAVLSGMSGIEKVTFIEQGDNSIVANFFDGNFTAVASNTITVNGTALNDTFSNDGNGEGGETINAGGVGAHNFNITTGTGADSITTGGGNDTIDGGADYHDINGGTNYNDTVNSGAGNDVVTTHGGNDSITAGTGNDSVNAGEGNNSVWAGDGNDTVTTGGGADSVEGGDGNDRISSGGGNDTVFGGNGDDSVDAGAGNDQVAGGAGNDTINGNDGNDTIVGGAGADVMDGGAGADTFIYQARSDSSGLLSSIDTINNFESGSDVLDIRYVGLDPAVVPSAAGKTLVFAGNAVNYADATAGVHNGNGIIEAVYQQDEHILWVDLNDDGSLDNNDLRIKVNLSSGNSMTGADIMSGTLLGTIIVNDGQNVTGTIANDNFTHVGNGSATINGGDGNDTLNGSDTGVDVLNGGAGNDVLIGNGGNDVLTGGAGNDTMTGGAGSDTFNVDAGSDTITDWTGGTDALNVTAGATANIATTGGNDTVDLSANVTNNGTVAVDGGGGNDTIIGDSGFDSISGGSGDDSVDAGNGNDWVSGGDGNDFLFGGAGNDTINGDAGNDTIAGWTGADQLNGGAGDDVIHGEDNDTIDGGTGTDTLVPEDGSYFGDVPDNQLVNVEAVDLSLTGSAWNRVDLTSQTEAFTVTGSTGNDTVTGGHAADTIDGGAGNDYLDGGPGANSITGGAGDDTILGHSSDVLIDGGPSGDYDQMYTDGNFDDTSDAQITNIDAVVMQSTGNVNLDAQSEPGLSVYGSSGNDTVVAGSGGDYVVTWDGNDSIVGGVGADSLYGGSGNDTIVGDDNDAILVGGQDNSGASGNFENGYVDTLQTDGSFNDTSDGQIREIEAVTMSAAGTLTLDDQHEGFSITGSAGADTIIAGSGNDTIDGGQGADSIDGGLGADSVSGGAGNDTIVGNQADAFYDGGTGTDHLQVGANFDDSVNLHDAGIVSVEVVDVTADALVVSLAQQTENLTINGFATGAGTITGGSGNDTITGGTGADSLLGGGGADSIVGGAGNDTLTGGPGNDTLVGGANNDTYNVDSGTDTITNADWAQGTNVLNVSAGATASITGTSGADTINLSVGTVTNAGTIVVDAGNGNDTITGSAAAESILGGAGDDSIVAGAGNDTLVGGTGSDTMTGGANADTFVLDMSGTNGTDTITDFTVAQSDVLKVGQDATALQVINSNGSFDLDVNSTNGHVVLITDIATNFYTGVLTDVSDNGLIEQLISGAIENVSPGASTFGGPGSWFTVILDNGTDTGVYRVNVTADDGNLGSGDFNIALVGVLTGLADASTITDPLVS